MDELLNELLYPVSQLSACGRGNQSMGGVSHSQTQVYNVEDSKDTVVWDKDPVEGTVVIDTAWIHVM